MDQEKWNDFLTNYTEKSVLEYLDQLDDKDKEIILIAVDHLETSFSVERSNGYQKWIKS